MSWEDRKLRVGGWTLGGASDHSRSSVSEAGGVGVERCRERSRLVLRILMLWLPRERPRMGARICMPSVKWAVNVDCREKHTHAYTFTVFPFTAGLQRPL